MLGVLQSNRENVLNAIHGLQDQLVEIESALTSENFSKLELILNQSRAAYQALTNN
jgi:prephenate dehydrogenase